MCSIAIPSELLLGHSPPVYNSLLYNSLMVTTPSITNRSIPRQIRPCLISNSLHINGLLNINDNVTCTKRNKKKVVFADDRGRPLTQVRVMSEPSNMPPLWTGTSIANLTRNDLFWNSEGRFTLPQQHLTTVFCPPINRVLCTSTYENVNFWELSFVQPISNYLTFRSKLEKDSVSLENVFVRDNENCLIGTVKVKNLAYIKTVMIRSTIDNWRNYEDFSCVYVEQQGLGPHTVMCNIYDTFRFCIPLPVNNVTSCQIEFCIHYNSNGHDFWDNNYGANYVIKKKQHANAISEFDTTIGTRHMNHSFIVPLKY